MKPSKKHFATWAIASIFISTAALAAPPTLGSIMGKLASPLTDARLPTLGTVGQTSLFSLAQLPGLKLVKLPVVGSLGGIPVLGDLTTSEGVATLQALAPLQKSLAGR